MSEYRLLYEQLRARLEAEYKELDELLNSSRSQFDDRQIIRMEQRHKLLGEALNKEPK